MRKLHVFLVLLVAAATCQAQTLAERLGYQKTDRILIINNDDAGMCHAANVASMEGQERGLISSSTIMTVCSWYNEIAAYAVAHPERDFGVHLTLTAEWKNYRWGTVAPRTEVPGLYDTQGYMWKGVAEVYKASTPEEALIEGRAQIRKALASGIPVTHIDSHMGTYQLSPLYANVYMQLAKEFDLPLRMASQATCAAMGFPDMRAEFAKNGLVFPDYFIYEEFKANNYNEGNVEAFWEQYIRNLKPGVTEIYIHGSIDGDELRGITASAATRVKEFNLFTSDRMKALIRDEGIIVIGYRPLLELQRKGK